MKFFREFKEFAIKGNMIDIAIGVIIGTAFNKVVNAIVTEILMPPLALFTDGSSWENKKLILREAIVIDGGKNIDEIAIGYGKLLEAGIDFMVIAFTVFLVVKVMNTMKNKAEDPKNKGVTTPKNIELMNKTNDLLEQQNEYLKKVLETKK